MNISFDFLNNISTFLTTLLAILFAISVHEFGHAYVAYLNGDSTAKNMGRMNINPLSHLDIFGMLAMFLVGFGWAKPVPVNIYNFKNRRLGELTVSLAGIFMNLLSAVIFAIIYSKVDIYEIKGICEAMIIYNVGFAAFNILPIPPLDGWGLASSLLPQSINDKLERYYNYSFIILMLLLISGAVGFILTPIYKVFMSLVYIFL